MIQITPQMRVLVAVEPADFRKGMDGLARLCKDTLQQDPFCGWVFVFRNRPVKLVLGYPLVQRFRERLQGDGSGPTEEPSHEAASGSHRAGL